MRVTCDNSSRLDDNYRLLNEIHEYLQVLVKKIEIDNIKSSVKTDNSITDTYKLINRYI